MAAKHESIRAIRYPAFDGMSVRRKNSFDHRPKAGYPHERMRAVADPRQPVIAHVPQARPPEGGHEIIGRPDRHLLVLDAVDQ